GKVCVDVCITNTRPLCCNRHDGSDDLSGPYVVPDVNLWHQPSQAVPQPYLLQPSVCFSVEHRGIVNVFYGAIHGGQLGRPGYSLLKALLRALGAFRDGESIAPCLPERPNLDILHERTGDPADGVRTIIYALDQGNAIAIFQSVVPTALIIGERM